MLQPPPHVATKRVHYTEFVRSSPGTLYEVEWNYYRGEVGRLLAEGHEGKCVVIRGEQILGLYATREEAERAGYPSYTDDFLVQLIQEYETVWLMKIPRYL